MAVADARQGKAEAAQPRTQQRDSRAAPGLHPCRQKRQLVRRAGAEQGMTPDHRLGSEAFGRPFAPIVRSEERRAGRDGVSTCRSRGATSPYNKTSDRVGRDYTL